MLRRALSTGLLAALAALVVVVAPARGAEPDTTQHAQRGAVQATLVSSPLGALSPHTELTIVRDGATVFDGPLVQHGCSDCLTAAGRGSLAVRDLDGDGEPEVVVAGFTGGAHCCIVGLFYRYVPGTGYVVSTRNFGDPGFRVRNVDHRGTPELQTYDDAFAYAFTDYADSLMPVQVLAFRAGRLVDVTARRAYRPLVRHDAASALRTLRRARREHRDVRGVIAAYAADELRLHHRGRVSAVLRDARRRHEVDARFAPRLRRFLARLGYGR